MVEKGDKNSTNHREDPLVISSSALVVAYSFGIVMQLVMLFLKVNYESFHSKVQLFLSCFIPFAFCLEFHLYLGTVLLALFFLNCSLMYYYLVIKKQEFGSSPRIIYKQLLRTHRAAQGITLLGSAYFLFAIFFVLYTTPNEDRFQQRAYHALSKEEQEKRANNALMATFHLLESVFLVFLGGYIGCLQKDVARLCHAFIHIKFDNKKLKVSTNNTCVLCNMEIKTLSFLEASKTQNNNPNELNEEEKTITLDCNHKYHDICLRGYSTIGKKQTSPCCGEKLDTSKIYQQAPWESATSVWMETTEVIRLFLVFFFPMGMIVFVHHFKSEHLLLAV